MVNLCMNTCISKLKYLRYHTIVRNTIDFLLHVVRYEERASQLLKFSML